MILNDYFYCVTGADPRILYEEVEQRSKKVEGVTKVFKGLFFQTAAMKASFRSYPKRIYIDGTYKLVKKGFVFLIINAVDGNNYTHVAGVALLADEKAETLEAFIKCFIDNNEEACEQVTCIMTDKDLTERSVLKKFFPHAVLVLCKFHTLRSFKREITPANMEASKIVIQECLEILDVMVKTKEIDRFEKYYSKFCKIAPPKVKEYYEKNWHPIRHEWATCFVLELTQGDFTNNRTESMNAKIKEFVPTNSTLCDFIEEFFCWLNSRYEEQRHKLSTRLVKSYRDNIYPKDSPEFLYKNLLTGHAFELILPELQCKNALTMTPTDNEKFLGLSGGKNVTVTRQECDCSFYIMYYLPCRHIFNVRQKLNLCLFDEALCNREYILANDLGLQPVLGDINLKRRSMLSPPKISENRKSTTRKSCKVKSSKLDTVQDKFRDLTPIINDIHNQAANNDFEYRKAQLIEMSKEWRLGLRVKLKRCKNDGSNVSNNTTLEEDVSEKFLQMSMNAALLDSDRRNTDDEVSVDDEWLESIDVPADIKQKGRPSNVFKCTSKYK